MTYVCNDIKFVWLGFYKRRQKQPKTSKIGHFWTFFDSLENSVRFELNFLQPFYTIWGTYSCNDIKILFLGFEKQGLNWPRNSRLWTFSFIFLKTVVTIRTKFSTVVLNHIEVLSENPYASNEIFHSHFTLYGGQMCAMTSRPYGLDLRNIAKIDQEKTICDLFQFFFENCRNDLNEIFNGHFPLCGDLCVQWY